MGKHDNSVVVFVRKNRAELGRLPSALISVSLAPPRPYTNVSRDMRTRWDIADEASFVGGHQGNYRLHRKWEQFEARHKRRVIANVAVARELAGWCRSLAASVQQEQPWTDEETCAVPGPVRMARQRGGDPRYSYGQPAINR